MPSTSKDVASSGLEPITMPRSSLRIFATQATSFLAFDAGSTVKTWSYLFLKYRASLARRPARASATGDDSRPVVETFTKSTTYGTDPPTPGCDRQEHRTAPALPRRPNTPSSLWIGTR